MDRGVLREVYGYWVGELASPEEISQERIGMWMQQADETDRVVRERFGGRVAEAAAAEWDVEALSREEAVGLVVWSHFLTYHAAALGLIVIAVVIFVPGGLMSLLTRGVSLRVLLANVRASRL